MANINEHAKCRSRATAAVAAVLRYRVLSAHRLPGGAGEHHCKCDSDSERCNRVGGHDCVGAVARGRTDAFWKLPAVFVPVCLASYKAKMTRWIQKADIKRTQCFQTTEKPC